MNFIKIPTHSHTHRNHSEKWWKAFGESSIKLVTLSIPRPLPPHSNGAISWLSYTTSCQIHRLCQPFSCAGYQLKMDGYVQERAILGAYGSATELSGWQSKHEESSTKYIPV